MVRNEYSYWLTVRPGPSASTSLRQMLEILKRSDLGPSDAGLHFTLDDKEIRGEVNPDAGTMPQDDDISKTVETLALQHADYDFELTEMDEEDKSNGRTLIWHEGKKIFDNYTRIVPSENKYDDVTTKAIIEYLESLGHGDIAAMVGGKFMCGIPDKGFANPAPGKE